MKTNIVRVLCSGERPSGPIEQEGFSKCGTSNKDGLTAKCLPREFFDGIRNAEKADKFIENYTGSIYNLMNTRELKPQFDDIVKNWKSISNSSVEKVKEMIRIYAADA
jgi:hypothetical protein